MKQEGLKPANYLHAIKQQNSEWVLIIVLHCTLSVFTKEIYIYGQFKTSVKVPSSKVLKDYDFFIGGTSIEMYFL